MHFVYICRKGKNEELRYSIRSVVKNVPNAEITVVGGCPDWFNGHYIPTLQNKTKYENVDENIEAIINSSDISDDFVFMNDDFYILNYTSFIPVLHGGTLESKLETYKDLTPGSTYVRKLSDTLKMLRKMGIEQPLDYELHVPFNMNKNKLADIFNKYGTKMLIRSHYGNHYNIGGKQTIDVKIYKDGPLKTRSYNYNEHSKFLSGDDSCFSLISDMLNKHFPNPSRFENL